MPKALAYEIFNSPKPSTGTNATAFQFEQKESKQQAQLSKKKTLAPLPPMKKFGGYKPKILGGGNDFIPVRSDPSTQTQQESDNFRTRPTLTKPKPFIIGDKNVPMVLSTVEDEVNRNSLNTRLDDLHIYEEPNVICENIEVNNYHTNNANNTTTTNNNVLTNNRNTSSDGWFNPDEEDENSSIDHNYAHESQKHSSEAFTIHNEQENLINRNGVADRDPTTFATENPVFHNTDTDTDGVDSGTGQETQIESDPDLFIPAPDYDEKERTMDFVDEDPDDLIEEKQQQIRHRQDVRRDSTGMKYYDGEDLSKYLSDDEDDMDMFRANVATTSVNKMRLQQKHALFKTKAQSNTTAKRKSANKNKATAFNSVRNFSYADSKYGTSGKAAGQKMNDFSKTSNVRRKSSDHDSFLNTSQHGEGYETFLRTKHGVSPDEGYYGDRVDVRWNGKQRDGNVWKKLTVRLRNKMQKNGYDMKDH